MGAVKRWHQWVGRITLPAFMIAQIFVACPTVAAATNATTAADLFENPAPTAATTAAAADAAPAAAGDTNMLSRQLQIGTSTNLPALIQLNFEETDLRTVLLYLAEITGETILPGANVRGQVTIVNPKPVTPDEAKQIIFSILETMNYTIVKYPHLIKVVPSGDAKTRPIPTLKPPKDIAKMDVEDLIRAQVVYPRYISVLELQKFIEPLMTPGAGKIIVNEMTGAAILIDTGANIKRLLEIAELIDRQVDAGQIDIKIIKLEYSDEKELANLLNQIFTAPALKSPTAQKLTFSSNVGQPGAPGAPATPGQAPAAPGGAKPSTELDILKAKADVSFIAEERLHALIVIGVKYYFGLVSDIISKLDVPSSEKDDTVNIYPLQHAKADEIAGLLNDIFSSGTTQRSAQGLEQSRRESPFARSRTSTGTSVDRPDTYGADRRSQPPTSSRSTTPQQQRSGNTLTHLAGKVDVLFDEPSNSLILICSPKYLDFVKRLIDRLDQRVPQVWIEAVIVEVSRDKNFNLGLGWKDIFDHPGSDESLIKVLDTSLAPPLDANGNIAASPAQKGVAYAFGKRDKYGNFDPYFTIQTAEGIIDINVLSTPSILASNNEQAEINVGKSVPYVNYSTGLDTDQRNYSYDFEEISVRLNVVPIINKYREVTLETTVDVNEDGGRSNPDDLNAPPIKLSRQAYTKVVLQDGQTLVIGGLIKDDFKTTLNKVPILADIPIIKHAFRTRSDTKAKTELMIFITPHVVESSFEGDQLTTAMNAKYRGASSFISSRDRAALYDDVNRERLDVTIYDDWRTFEKHIEDAETYLQMRPPQGDTAETRKRSIFYFAPDEEMQKAAPFSGDMLKDDSVVTPPAPGTAEPPVPAPEAAAPSTLLERERALLQGVMPDAP
jgi:general secretion pathway protein D